MHALTQALSNHLACDKKTNNNNNNNKEANERQDEKKKKKKKKKNFTRREKKHKCKLTDKINDRFSAVEHTQ